MFRFKLRTLLIVLVLGPVVLWAAWSSRGVALGLLGAFTLIAPLYGLALLAKVCLDRRS